MPLADRPMERPPSRKRGRVSVLALSAALILHSFAFAVTARAGAPSPPLLTAAADSLLARATEANWLGGPRPGEAWRSVIQAPNFQTDRDVGAASVGMGLIAAYDVTGDERYLAAAQGAADFLIAAERPKGGGRWPDFFDPSGPAPTGFTSFDDGAAGIADFLWRLWRRDGAARDRAAALAAMDWEVGQARAPRGLACPSVCFWHWRSPATATVYTGMGEGVAGIAWSLDAFARRLAADDPPRARRYALYAASAAAWLETQMRPMTLPGGAEGAAMPEQPGTRIFDAGYLSGSAGDAFLFYRLFHSTGEPRYLTDADRLFAWVRGQAVADGACAGTKWPIQTSGGGSRRYATGVEEGDAGIGWVALQAWRTLAPIDPAAATRDLATARAAGNWLLSSCVATPAGGGLAWPEDEGRPLIHTSLDNGAPGIAIFLADLASASGEARYRKAALAGEDWIRSVTFSDARGAYWCENIVGGRWRLCREPSWHWGAAGIADMAARLAGWRLDIPGEQPGLDEDD